MEFTHAFILGVVQGITEFLPISSSAHLILVPKFVHWPDQGLLFDISVHVGTLLAVMIYFYRDVLTLIQGKIDVLRGRFHTVQAKLFMVLVVSTIPLVLVAPFIKDYIEVYARSYAVIGFTSIFFGLLLWRADRTGEKGCSSCISQNDTPVDAPKTVADMTLKQALFFGLFQAVAMIPGTSRSGICMTAGRFMGFSREDSSRYAMLMAMPVILMIGAYSLMSDFEGGMNLADNAQEIAVGALVSFVSAMLAIHLLMKFVNRIGFMPFVIYRVLLGVVLLYLTF